MFHWQPLWLWYLKPGSNKDECRWELAGESLHECFLNSHCSVKRAVRVARELTRVFLLFSIYLFLLVASPLFLLRFLMLVKLLTVWGITPTVTCWWYVIFSFFLLLLLMGNDLGIACFCNSLQLSCNSHGQSNKPNLSSTLIKIWTSSKLMRVHDGQTRARVATLIIVWSGLNIGSGRRCDFRNDILYAFYLKKCNLLLLSQV